MPVAVFPSSKVALSADEVDAWREIPVAIAVDLLPECQIDIAIRPLNPPGRQPKLAGIALTVLCQPPDFGAVVAALDVANSGDVLVIAASGANEPAMIGEILSGHLRSRGCAGIVCDGAVRDVAEISSWSDFSVFTRHINPLGPAGVSGGQVNAPIEIGGLTIQPGDLILGDDDGLVALSPADVRNRLGDAQAKLALETEWIDVLKAGKPAAEVFGIPVNGRK